MAFLSASSATSLKLALAYAAASMLGFVLLSMPVYAVAGGLGWIIAWFLSYWKPVQPPKPQSRAVTG
jgi:hypothetical protein